MTSTRITPANDITGTSIDLSTIDVDHALQRGRRLRAEALTSVLKSLFRSRSNERTSRNGSFSTDCAAPA